MVNHHVITKRHIRLFQWMPSAFSRNLKLNTGLTSYFNKIFVQTFFTPAQISSALVTVSVIAAVWRLGTNLISYKLSFTFISIKPSY